KIEEKSQIQPVLDSLLGIDSGEHVWLTIGRDFAVPGQFEEGHSKEDKIAAVHFVRFPLTPSQRRAFGREPVALVADHPSYRARTAGVPAPVHGPAPGPDPATAPGAGREQSPPPPLPEGARPAAGRPRQGFARRSRPRPLRRASLRTRGRRSRRGRTPPRAFP